LGSKGLETPGFQMEEKPEDPASGIGGKEEGSEGSDSCGWVWGSRWGVRGWWKTGVKDS
jgi:hypothetical protein